MTRKIMTSTEQMDYSIDYHCHLLPGLDDGAQSLDDALAMATQLATAGFAEVYCTPHCIRGAYDNTPALVNDAVKKLQAELNNRQIKLQLRPGMEYYLDEYFPAQLKNPQPLGETGLLLVEAPRQTDPQQILEHLFNIIRQGYIPLLAHPERYPWLETETPETGLLARLKKYLGKRAATDHAAVISQPSTLRLLLDMGCRLQANLGSFTAFYGPQVQHRALALRQGGYYFCYGSDGHTPAKLQHILHGLDKSGK